MVPSCGVAGATEASPPPPHATNAAEPNNTQPAVSHRFQRFVMNNSRVF
jgi:hypothetical protein